MVDFALTDENRLVQQSARAFAEAEILPHIREWDEHGPFPRELFGKMAEQGFLGAPIPERYGGSGMDYISFAILCEELERADTAFRVVQSVHVGLNSLALLQWATEEQRQRWLVPQARGEKLATFGLTEPGVGTDAGNLATTARRDGSAYRLNGQKIWISLADVADHFLVFASEARLRDAEIRLAETQTRSSITVNAGVKRLEASDDEALVFGFTMPLGSGARARVETARAAAFREQVDAEREGHRVRAEAQLFELYQELRHSITEVEVLKSNVLPEMEAALEAVRQWEFTPTLLNGLPVPVIMTTTVNFTLQ